ncbi:MAG: glycoside hydrolase family 3 N-terminal domain-containing protein [Bacteroidales bacterium]
MRYRYFFLNLILFLLFSNSKSALSQADSLQTVWVDSVFQSLSLNEKIGQLIFVRANVSGEAYDERVSSYISRYNIGGITFFKAKAVDQLKKTNEWQALAKTPLLITIDGEWGLGMRLSDAVSYPYQMTLGAVSNDSLIYQMGTQIAEQCKRMGIHSNFSPVVDINNNPANPVIGMRSFGDSPALVAHKAALYANALRDHGILATAKHFPGHGNTQSDSHKTLPTIEGDRDQLNQTELFPFQYLIHEGLEGIMVAHLNVPALEPVQGTPSTLSKSIITGLLKQELGFKGLVISDALDMKGVTEGLPAGEIGLKAFMAGNDVLLIPADIPATIQSIRTAIETGTLPMTQLEESCRKILQWKYRAGLSNHQPCPEENLILDLQNTDYHSLVYDLYRDAVTLVKDDNILSKLGDPKLKIATVAVGYSKTTGFQHELTSAGLKATHFLLPKNADQKRLLTLKQSLAKFDLVIISIQNTNILASKKFGIEDQAIKFVNELMKTKQSILTIFASPYALNQFSLTPACKSILIAYQDNDNTASVAAGILTGRLASKGRLPVSLSTEFPAGTGIIGSEQFEIQQIEKKTSIDESILRKIDSVAQEGISKKAYPGCQVLALKDGEVIYQRSFGFHTYSKIDSVKNTDLYDLASLTKMLSSTLAIMKLYEDKKIKLEDTLGKFFPYLKGSTKSKLKLIDIMTHQAGLDGWIPFHLETFSDAGPDPKLYSSKVDLDHPYRVAENMYMIRTYKNKIFGEIADSKMKTKEYRYSDLGFYFMPDLVELLTNQKFDEYVYTNFYQALGLTSTCFRPLTHFPKNQIVPTEDDKEFRHQLLQGDVHDYGAALLGGISGHAGLFSNAAEVGIIMQMLLNGGEYNGKRILQAETIKTFTSAPFASNKNRRGIGFDKTPLDKNEARMPAPSASSKSFGHSGFTGTFAWADPENKLVFVFLSNRIYPDANNQMISKLNTRTVLHETFYKAIQLTSPTVQK